MFRDSAGFTRKFKMKVEIVFSTSSKQPKILINPVMLKGGVVAVVKLLEKPLGVRLVRDILEVGLKDALDLVKKIKDEESELKTRHGSEIHLISAETIIDGVLLDLLREVPQHTRLNALSSLLPEAKTEEIVYLCDILENNRAELNYYG